MGGKKFFLLSVVMVLWLFSGLGEACSFSFSVSAQELESIDRLMVSPFLRLDPDRGNFGTYYVGENIILEYWSGKGGYVSIFDYPPSGEAQIIKNNEPIVAEAKRKLYGVVSHPEGMERFVMVLSPRMIPDRLLVEAMRNPSRIRNILGEDVAIQRSVIQVIAERRLAPSFLQFDRVPNEISAGGKVRIALFLSDESGNALVGRRIQWEVSDGTLDHYQTLTNTAGKAEVWYTAPRMSDPLEVRITARFEGDMVYRDVSQEVKILVNPDKVQTLLTLSPETFQIVAGESIEFQAELRDLRGQPVVGRSIRWMASRGSFAQEVTYTDERGQTRNSFFAPQTEGSETIEVKASFVGVRNLLPSEDLSYGTVSGVGVSVGMGFYYVDFSAGKAYTNFEALTYLGNVAVGYTINPASSLVLTQEGYLEVGFFVSQPLHAGALYLWGQTFGNVTVQITMNGSNVFTGRLGSGTIQPTDSYVIALTDWLTVGHNTLRIGVKSQDRESCYALQRLMIAF